jgi:hypothetical protein
MAMLLRDGVLIGDQANLTTAVTPTDSLSITEWDLQKVPEEMKSEQIQTNSVESIAQIGHYSFEGFLTCEVGGQSHDKLLKYVHGNAATSSLGIVYTHTFKFGTSLAEKQTRLEKGLTIEGGSDGVFFTATGACLDGYTLDIVPGEFIKKTYNFMAYDGDDEAASGETHAPDSVLKMYDPFDVTFKAGILASEVTIPILSASLSVSKGVTPRFGNITQQKATKFQENDNTEVVLTFSIDQDATERAAIKTALQNGTLSSVIIELVSDQIISGDSASTPFSHTYNLKEGKYVGVTKGTDGSTRTEEYTFRLGKSALADPMTVVVINDNATI